MGEFTGFDLERSTAAAWTRFRARLADHIAEMRGEDVLIVEAECALDEGDGAPPYVQFAGFGEDLVRGEVASNDFLAREFHLDHQGTLALLELGYVGPSDSDSGSPNFFVDLRTGEADRAAVMAVAALRDVFGVPHPAFLVADGLAGEEPVPTGGRAASEASVGRDHEQDEPDEAIARYPRGGQEQLREYVDEALTPYFGHAPEHDDDGDVPVTAGSSMFWVMVLSEVPVVRLMSCVVDGVKDRERAALEVGLLNRHSGAVKFTLDHQRIIAILDLPAWPFVPEHLRTAVASMANLLDDLDDDLALRVSGRTSSATADVDGDDAGEDEDELEFDYSDPDERDEELPQPAVPADDLHPALATLHELEVSRPGSLDPRLVASICHMDIELILSFIRLESSQAGACSDALEAAEDVESDDECLREMHRAERSIALLRRALRVVVDTEAGRESEEPDLWSDARAVTPKKKLPPKKRKAPDPTLEEVDPEMWRPEW